MRALCYAQTNIGSGRDNNEDNYYCNGTFKRDPAIPVAEAAAEQESRRLIYGVFDGMGGEANGEQAALLCAQTLHQCSSDEPFDALDFFRRANVAVCDMIAASGQIGGSTAATVHLTGNRAYCCNVGDSRIYLQRGGALQRISRDHTKYQEQLDTGAAAADAADNPDRHVLTQYLGMLGARQRLMPYFAASVPLAVGDRLLLCTDGLTGKLSDSQLQAALGADLPLPELGQALMAQALAAGPGDNITLVLIEVTALDPETAVPLPQPPVEELSQTRRFEVSAERIAEQETQRKKQARARRREWVLTVSVILAVLCAVVAALWIAIGSIPRKPPAPAPTPVQTMRSTLAGYCTFPKPPESIFSGTAALDDVELSILRLACEGKSRREIAAELFMSEGTIKRRISEILSKTGYDNIMRLAVRAVTEGSIVPNMER